MRQIDQERPVAVGFDKPFGSGGQVVLAFATFGFRRRRVGLARVVLVKSLFSWTKTLAADVPFPDAGGRVTGGLEVLGQRLLFERQFHADSWMPQLLGGAIGAARQIGGQVQARRGFAS